ncbi:MAG: nuclear transport factor 2 family protein [Bacteroidota bacterium]|nr:nuclear transport factor 2 family protein [Bacteroidota bacterium]
METLATVKKEQNIQVVQNGFADFLKGNIPGLLDSCNDDIVWGSYDNPLVPYAGTYHGKKGVAEFFTTLAGHIDYSAFEPKEFFADGDHVFVKGYHAGTVKSTHKTFGHDFMMVFQIQDGKIKSFFAWVDSRDQAAAFTK